MVNVTRPAIPVSSPAARDEEGNRLFAEEGSAEGCASGECLPDEPPSLPEPEPEPAPVSSRSGADDLTRGLQERWRSAVDKVKTASSRHGASLAFGRLLWLRQGEVAIAYPPEMGFHRSTVSAFSGRAIIEKLLSEHFGRPTRLVIEDGAAAVAQAAKVSLAEEDQKSRAAHEKSTDQMVRTHPAVRATLKLLGGEIEHVSVFEQERPTNAVPTEAVEDGS